MSAEQVIDWIRNDPLRWRLLGHVRDLGLPDCWIGAGFVRNAVWSILHDESPQLTGDIDVIWFDPSNTSEARDRALEARLRSVAPGFQWSVNNQARMHLGNGDAPYVSTENALQFWPETATAIALRRIGDDDCKLIAPFGLGDLIELKVRAAGEFTDRKRSIFETRLHEKRWLVNFPKLVLVN